MSAVNGTHVRLWECGRVHRAWVVRKSLTDMPRPKGAVPSNNSGLITEDVYSESMVSYILSRARTIILTLAATLNDLLTTGGACGGAAAGAVAGGGWHAAGRSGAGGARGEGLSRALHRRGSGRRPASHPAGASC